MWSAISFQNSNVLCGTLVKKVAYAWYSAMSHLNCAKSVCVSNADHLLCTNLVKYFLCMECLMLLCMDCNVNLEVLTFLSGCLDDLFDAMFCCNVGRKT